MLRKRIVSCILAAVLILCQLPVSVMAAGTGGGKGQSAPVIPYGQEVGSYVPERDGYYAYLKITGGESLLRAKGVSAGYLPVLVFNGKAYVEASGFAGISGLKYVREDESKCCLSVYARSLIVSEGSDRAVYMLRADESWKDVLLAVPVTLSAPAFVLDGAFWIPLTDTVKVLGLSGSLNEETEVFAIGEARRNVFDFAAELYGEQGRKELEQSLYALEGQYGKKNRYSFWSLLLGEKGILGRLGNMLRPSRSEMKQSAEKLLQSMTATRMTGPDEEAAEGCIAAVRGYVHERLSAHSLSGTTTLLRIYLTLPGNSKERAALANLMMVNDTRNLTGEDLLEFLPFDTGEQEDESGLLSAVIPQYITVSGKMSRSGGLLSGGAAKGRFYIDNKLCGSLASISPGSFSDIALPCGIPGGFTADIHPSFRVYASLTRGSESALVYADTAAGERVLLPEAYPGAMLYGNVSGLGSEAPVAGATVKLYRKEAGSRILLGTTYSGTNGSYVFRNIPYSSNYYITAEKNSFSAEVSVPWIRGNLQAPVLRLPGAMAGTVKGGDSLGVLPHTKVILSGGGQSRVLSTNKNGAFFADDLPLGSYVLSFSKPGYRQAGTSMAVNSAASVVGLGDIVLQKEPVPQNIAMRMSPVYDMIAGSTAFISAELRTDAATVPNAGTVIWSVDAPEGIAFWGDNFVRTIKPGYHLVSRALMITEPGEYEVAANFGGCTVTDTFRIEPTIAMRTAFVDGYLEIRVETTLAKPDAAFLESFLKAIRVYGTPTRGMLGIAGERLEIRQDGTSGAYVLKIRPSVTSVGTGIDLMARTNAGQIIRQSYTIGSGGLVNGR